MKHLHLLAVLPLALASCTPGGGEDYDTGYDTSDPYGNPAGYEADPYQQVNPPADPTYGSAAYEETTPAPVAPVAPPSRTPPPAIASSHTVAKGDTLWGLSRKYGVSVDAIRSANGMASGDTNIRLGQTLSIPAP